MSAQHTPAVVKDSLTTRNGYTDAFGPNVSQILCQAMRVIRGPIPAQVRAELRAAVKAGVLGHLRKDGLKPEIFFHLDHKNGALERQNREAAYSVSCIAKVMVSPADFRAGIEAMGGDVEKELIARSRATGSAS